MEHLALGLVWLLGTLASGSPECQRDLDMPALDMAPNSFDDRYLGCAQTMEAKLKELNHTEFKTNKIYAEAWKEATTVLQGHMPQLPVLPPPQAIALMAYTLNHPALFWYFNAAVREAGRSPEQYLHKFHFKVMHFLLTQALRALREAQPQQCYHVYRGIKKVFTAQPGDTVRFGQFASTSLNKKCAEWFGKGTVFSVKTCYGVPIWNFSYYALEKEVLIPPFETFEVTGVTHQGNSARIELQSQGVHSNYNCEYVNSDVWGDTKVLASLPEKQCKNQPCDFSAGQSVSHDPLWGFLLAATALATAVGI